MRQQAVEIVLSGHGLADIEKTADRFLHPIHRGRQFVDFQHIGFDADRRRKVETAHGFGLMAQLAQGLGNRPGNQQGDRDRHDHDRQDREPGLAQQVMCADQQFRVGDGRYDIQGLRTFQADGRGMHPPVLSVDREHLGPALRQFGQRLFRVQTRKHRNAQFGQRGQFGVAPAGTFLDDPRLVFKSDDPTRRMCQHDPRPRRHLLLCQDVIEGREPDVGPDHRSTIHRPIGKGRPHLLAGKKHIGRRLDLPGTLHRPDIPVPLTRIVARRIVGAIIRTQCGKLFIEKDKVPLAHAGYFGNGLQQVRRFCGCSVRSAFARIRQAP